MSDTAEQVDIAVNEIAKGAVSQAEETSDANNAVINIGTQIAEVTGSVEELNSVTAQMTEANKSADETIVELNTINEKTEKSIGDISESTKKDK